MTPEILKVCKLATVEYDSDKLLALVQKIHRLCDERRAQISAIMRLDQPLQEVIILQALALLASDKSTESRLQLVGSCRALTA